MCDLLSLAMPDRVDVPIFTVALTAAAAFVVASILEPLHIFISTCVIKQ